MDPDTIRDEINPRTRQLFDVLEQRLAGAGSSREQRRQARRMAFSAWTAALGLVTMLSMAAASKDPLIHADADLLDCLAEAFERAAAALSS